jgi:nicotinamide riboside transporter PnuC
MTLWIELTAAAFGVLGTLLLALNGKRAGWGFVAYLVSNAGWILFAWIHAHWALLVQQLFFTATSGLGIYVWLWKPRRRYADQS